MPHSQVIIGALSKTKWIADIKLSTQIDLKGSLGLGN